MAREIDPWKHPDNEHWFITPVRVEARVESRYLGGASFAEQISSLREAIVGNVSSPLAQQIPLAGSTKPAVGHESVPVISHLPVVPVHSEQIDTGARLVGNVVMQMIESAKNQPIQEEADHVDLIVGPASLGHGDQAHAQAAINIYQALQSLPTVQPLGPGPCVHVTAKVVSFVNPQTAAQRFDHATGITQPLEPHSFVVGSKRVS